MLKPMAKEAPFYTPGANAPFSEHEGPIPETQDGR